MIKIISNKSRGTPRVANRLLKIMRDYHTIGKNLDDNYVVEEIFEDI
ncbi:MAG: hypothetical protein LBU14_03160 [Candidatus Peribacteria bacterium]|nr:hypothetical protein [Candidatus Peribacteria bacterium]